MNSGTYLRGGNRCRAYQTPILNCYARISCSAPALQQSRALMLPVHRLRSALRARFTLPVANRFKAWVRISI
jgi:hypothetical protein